MQGIGIWLPLMLRIIPAKNFIRQDAKMGGIIPCDIFAAGMRYYTDPSAFFFLSANDPVDAGERRGNMGSDVFFPAQILINQLLLREMIPFSAHIRASQMAATLHVLLQCDGGAGAQFGKNFHEKGVIYGGFTLYHCIIVVKNKAGIFQHNTPRIRFLSL
jgi:hypothetical protein